MKLYGRRQWLLLAPALLASTVASAQETTVKIGAALSMTGGAASYGANQKNGIQLAVEEINAKKFIPGVKLELVIEDDQSTPQQGITVFDRLINQYKVAAIIGPTLSTTAQAADPRAQQAKVPVLAVSNTSPKGITDIGPYIWRVSLTEAQVIPQALKKAEAKFGFKTAGVLYGNDDVFTKAGYDVMKTALEQMGIKTVGTETFAKKNVDFNAQLTKLIGLKPDILVVSALIEEASAIVVQARQLGYKGPILGGNGFNNPVLMKNAGAAAENVIVGTAWFSASTDPVNVKFKQAMEAKGHTADQFAAQAYTGVYVIAEAIRLSGGKGTREDVKNGFAKVKNLDTPLGKFSFLPNRDAASEPAVQIVKDGKFQILQ